MTAPKTPAAKTPTPRTTTTKPKKTGLELLREPFAPNQIGKLPKPFFKDSPKQNCRDCGGYHGFPCVHIDYVGHAALTDRLLDADPEWNWEPVARDQYGLPLMVNGGLWIKLTVCGVTRLGFGDAQGKSGPNATKEAIGDALRNAAMRFGAALDLWHKGDLHQFKEEQGFQPSEYDYPVRDVNQEPNPPQAPQNDPTPTQAPPHTRASDSAQQQPPQPSQNQIYDGTQPVLVETDIPALVHEFEETVFQHLPAEGKTALSALWKKANLPYPPSNLRTQQQIDKAWELYEQVKPAPMQQPGPDVGNQTVTPSDAAMQQLRQQQQAAARRHFPEDVPADNYGPEPDYA